MNTQEFLAFSSPYELKIQWKDGEIVTLSLKNIRYITDNLFNVKLLLHPLSDITKEIEHNGQKFKPSYILTRDFKGAEDFIFLLIQIINGKEDIDLFKFMKYCPINIFQMLIEWHFDVCDLIKKGEAIDINTFEINPYK